MKLVINYDFFNAVLDVNEGFTPMKIVRNNKKGIVLGVPSFFTMNYVLIRSLPDSIKILGLQTLSFFALNYVYKFYYGYDPYKEASIDRLRKLSYKLNDIFVNTDYDLLLKSEIIKKEHKIHLNEDKIPDLLENKYVLVPTYDFNGNIKNTSILQEHIVGSNEYVLSVGSPKKELKLAYSRT